jgi:hypothetical protein
MFQTLAYLGNKPRIWIIIAGFFNQALSSRKLGGSVPVFIVLEAIVPCL